MASKSGHNDFYQDGRELLLRTRLAGKKISENKQASMQYTKEQEDAKAAQCGGLEVGAEIQWGSQCGNPSG